MEPWERLTDEPSKAFAAFIVYRDLDPRRRSLSAAAAIACDLDPKADPPALADRRRIATRRRVFASWSVAHAWTQRVIAWDEHLDTVRIADREHAIRDMADRHAEVGRAMFEVGAAALPAFDLTDLSADDARAARVVVTFCVQGARLEREAYGIDPGPVAVATAGAEIAAQETADLLRQGPEVVDAIANLLLARSRADSRRTGPTNGGTE